MSDEPEQIRPLATGEYITKQYQQMRPLICLLGLFNPDMRRQSQELDRQFADVERMKEDRRVFASRFGPHGWTIYDRLSVDAVRAAVAEPDDSVAEQGLVAHHLDQSNLASLGHRFNSRRFEAWHDLYTCAEERLMAGDYLSAVPLILIIIDGICTTKTGKHPFSGGADAPVFDTETVGPGGISDGLAVLGSVRRGLNTHSIDSPYRHGILHGLDTNFGNAFVAAKAVNLLQTMVDYFDRREDEEARIAKAAKDQRQPSWAELVAKVSATEDTRRRIDEWVARPQISERSLASAGETHNLQPDSPEAMAAAYLDAIVTRNFGRLAQMTIDYPLRSIGYRAGRLREELSDLKVTYWRILGIRDEAPAISEIDVSIEGILNNVSWTGVQTMRLIYNDDKFEVLVRGAPNGSWAVVPNFLPNLWGTALGSLKSSEIQDHDT